MTGSRSRYTQKPLTDIQLCVLRYIKQGMTNKEIAEKVQKSVHTIDSSIDAICTRLMLGSDVTREQLPERARALGIVFDEQGTIQT